MFDDKAQLHTLEGIAAATLILLVIIYAIDATSMTPLTSSTASVHMESDIRSLGIGILNTLDYAEPGYNSKLKGDISGWNGTQYIWNGNNYIELSDSGVGSDILTNNITEVMNGILINGSITHNVVLNYLVVEDNETIVTHSNLIYNGQPSDNSVIVSRKIVLHDGDINTTVYPDNPIDDIDTTTNFWNIVDVNIILWRL